MLARLKAVKLETYYAWILGFGLASFGFRNQYYPGISIGICLCIVVVAFVLLDRKNWRKEILGSKYVYIPVIIILASIIISGFYQFSINKDTASLFARIMIAVLFFGVYLASRKYGESIFKPFAIAVVVETASLIGFSFVYGIHNGGFAATTAYNVASALLLFGAIVSIFYKQWLVVTIALIGLCLTGAEEAVVGVIVIGITILIRRDFSKKLLVPIGLLLVVGILGIYPFNYTIRLYAVPIDKITLLITGHHNERALSMPHMTTSDTLTPEAFNGNLDYMLHGRLQVLDKAFQEWQWLGSGYVVNPVDAVDNPIYNVPLVIAQQIGIIGALAWLFLIIYCLIKTKWKYAFIAIIAMGLFDNIMWCQFGIYLFALVGVSTVSERKSDLIFREVK